MKKVTFFICSIFTVLTLTNTPIFAGMLDFLDGAYQGFQKDADIVKLKHLQYYGELIEEYKEKTGKYPLQGGKPDPIYVHVTNSEQVDDVQGAPPYKHWVVYPNHFFKELSKGLGREVKEYYDPQYAPDKKPNFYIYMIYKDTFFFSVHLHQTYPFARKLGPGYNKLEISNKPTPANRAQSSTKLFQQKDYQTAMNKKMSKPDFFKAREKKFLFSSKDLKL